MCEKFTLCEDWGENLRSGFLVLGVCVYANINTVRCDYNKI